MARSHSRRTKPGKGPSLGAVLAGLVAVVSLCTTGIAVYKYFTKPVLQTRYVFLKDDCMYLFARENGKPREVIDIPKLVFAPDGLGLTGALRKSLAVEQITGGKTHSALFLLVHNVSGESAERLVFHTNQGDGATGTIQPDETIVICVDVNWDGKSSPAITVKDIDFIVSSGLKHQIKPGPLTPASNMVTSKDCVLLGYPNS